jgi:hypothetical protein
VGFDTYLQIDDRILLMWRKHAGVLPRVLFRYADLYVRTGDDEDGAPTLEVGFEALAEDILKTLAEGGLGWRAAVAAYAEVRFSGYSAGFLMGTVMSEGGGVDRMERAKAAFEELSPETDLLSLGELMVGEWRDERDEISLLSTLTYDGDLPSAYDAAFKTWENAHERGIENAFAAGRAAESLAMLDRTAPMLAWPLLVCIFLHQLPSDATVRLVLTEDAAQSGDVVDEETAREYTAGYWSRASDALASEARTLERLFAVLAGSTLDTGSEFWFARAADLLERMRVLNKTPDVTNHARGDVLESLIDALLRTEAPEVRVVEKNLRTEEEEIDLVLSNGLSDPFWSTLTSPIIFVECKNWSKKAGVPELRIFESKMRDRAAVCRIGIFVSRSGFTSPFMTRLKAIQADVGVIFAIDGVELAELVSSKRRITDWLREEGLRRSLGVAS